MKTILNTLDYTLLNFDNVHHHSKYGHSCASLFDYARFQNKRIHQAMSIGEKSLSANFEINEKDDNQLSLIRTDSEGKEPVLFLDESLQWIKQNINL